MPSNTSPHKPDPYTGFKDDCERRRALNWRSTCRATTAVAASFACAGVSIPWADALRWLKTFL
jgi:hypothetical protein